ncbi:MAG: universal stress protein [Vicinamibacterales bacterium]
MSQHALRHLVVGVDFGPASALAVHIAAKFVEAFGGRLTVLHAETVDVPPYFTRDQLDVVEREVRTARRQAVEAVRQFAAPHAPPGFDVRVTESPPVESLLDPALDADLLAVGTHGRRGPARWWLGSVAERVVRGATVPVLVVHETRRDWRRDGPVLLLGGQSAPSAARQWAEDASAAFSSVPLELGPSPDRCHTAASNALLVVVPVAGAEGTRTIHEGIIALGRTCSSPLLFVPE